jgi:hypothetical protein
VAGDGGLAEVKGAPLLFAGVEVGGPHAQPVVVQVAQAHGARVQHGCAVQVAPAVPGVQSIVAFVSHRMQASVTFVSHTEPGVLPGPRQMSRQGFGGT